MFCHEGNGSMLAFRGSDQLKKTHFVTQLLWYEKKTLYSTVLSATEKKLKLDGRRFLFYNGESQPPITLFGCIHGEGFLG